MFFLLLCQSETNDVISRSETSVAAGPFLNNFIKEQKHKQWRVYFWWIYYDGRHLGEEMALQAWTTGTPKNIHIHIRNSLLLRARKLSNHIPRSTVRSTQQRQKDHFPLPLYCYTIHIDRQQKKERLKRATETWFGFIRVLGVGLRSIITQYCKTAILPLMFQYGDGGLL